MVLSWGKDECLHVGEEIEWVVLLPSIVLLTRSSLLRWLETLVLWRWAIEVIRRLWELVIFASKVMSVVAWLWRLCNMFLNCLHLISITTLDKQGYDNYFSNGKCKLNQGSFMVAKGKLCRTFYKTLWKCVEMYYMLWKMNHQTWGTKGWLI